MPQYKSELKRDLRAADVLPWKYGEIDNSGIAVLTTLTSAGTFYKVEGTTTLAYGVDFDQSAEARLRYTGNETIVAMVFATLDFTSNTNNHDVTWDIRKNASTTVARAVTVRKGTAADRNEVSLHGMYTLATNDYLELFVSSSAAGVTVTNSHFTLSAVVVGITNRGALE